MPVCSVALVMFSAGARVAGLSMQGRLLSILQINVHAFSNGPLWMKIPTTHPIHGDGRKRPDRVGCKMPARKRSPQGPQAARRKPPTPTRRWSARVTRDSDALDLESGVFSLKDPKRIAASP